MSEYHNYYEFENMLANILEEGEREVWQSLEEIKSPFERCKARKLYALAVHKIQAENL